MQVVSKRTARTATMTPTAVKVPATAPLLCRNPVGAILRVGAGAEEVDSSGTEKVGWVTITVEMLDAVLNVGVAIGVVLEVVELELEVVDVEVVEDVIVGRPGVEIGGGRVVGGGVVEVDVVLDVVDEVVDDVVPVVVVVV